MPINSVPDLPALHPELCWLFSLKPTQEELERYTHRMPLPAEAPAGADRWFTISNIFASPTDAPRMRKSYDWIRSGCLANAEGTALLTIWADDVDECPESERRDYQRHKQDVWRVCSDLCLVWEAALDTYEGGEAAPELDRARLHLEPHVSLPSPELIRALYAVYNTWSLLLITARHELGYLYRKVEDWHKQACTLPELSMDILPACLDHWDLGLLSARTRGYLFVEPGHADSAVRAADYLAPIRRTDAPCRRLSPDSSLAMLYWHFRNWYEYVYYATVNARKCNSRGCPRLAKGWGGVGPVPSLCGEHTKAHKREIDRQRQQRRRDGIKSGVIKPTPHAQLRDGRHA